ncbi:hypothetical protein [Salinivirga cyanobacteriivorans]
MKSIAGIIIMSLIASVTVAQVDEDWEAYKEQQEKREQQYFKQQDELLAKYAEQMDKYIEKLDKEWQDYLEKKFKEFELYKESQPDIGPKPEEMPKAEDNAEAKEESVEYKEVKQLQKKPAEVEKPILQKTAPKDFATSSQYFDFYGTDISMDYDRSFLNDFPDNISEQVISQKYGEMSKTNYNHLLEQLTTTSNEMNLNDWGYYLLLKNASEQIAGDDAGAVFLQWFLLIKSNYRARIAYKGDNLYLLIPAANNIYDVPFFTFNGIKYYLINGDRANVLTYDKDFPEATKIFDLNIDRPLNTELDEAARKVSFTYIGEPFEFEVAYNKNVIDYYNDFPLSDATVYFDATVAGNTKQSLKEGLQPIIADKSEKEAASILLRFVQTAFDYKTDQEQFGKEKFFFADELFNYPYSDCEDRSVLFAYLVKELMQLDVVGVGYSGHMATAVKFNEDIEGQYINYKDEKYTICDPTYINAPIGMTMPQYAGTPAEIFQLRNKLNEAYAEREIWGIVMDMGGYRGNNTGDIITDEQGNIYLTGYFSGTLKFGRYELNSEDGSRDMFVLKVDKDLNIHWAQSFGGEGTETGYGIAQAPNGDVVVTGSFDESFNFGYKYLKAKEMPDVLVARIKPNGDLVWAQQVGLEEIGLQQGFMFTSEFEYDGDPVGNQIFKEAEQFQDFGLAINEEGNIYVTGAPYEMAGLGVQTASYDAGASFSAPEVLIEENSKLLEKDYNPAIAGLFAVIKLLNNSSIALPGEEAQRTLDKYNPEFKKRSPHIYKSIGRIQFIKNSEGIVTIKTDNQGEVSFKTLKVNNNARFKVSAYNSGNSQIDVLGGVSIGKSIIWYDLNAVKLYKTGDMIMDYDVDHTRIRMGIEKDILR